MPDLPTPDQPTPDQPTSGPADGQDAAGLLPDDAPEGPLDREAGEDGDVLRAVVLEIEAYAAETGWDQPARLFALVPTADLLAREPGLAEALGVDGDGGAESLTPVEQEPVSAPEALEEMLGSIMWPAEVVGCAAVVERLVLPPAVDDELPDDPDEAQRFAAEHPDRQEVRIVAATTRGGASYCALRLRSDQDDVAVVEGPRLVPGLLELLSATLEQ